MRPVQILTDSCSDLGKEIRERYAIDYAQMRTVYEGKETPASLDWEYYTPKALYDIMRAGNRVLTTQVPMDEFDRVFRKYLDKGCDIVYIGCSLKQSSSVDTGTVVANKLMEEYPGAEIYCIDSRRASMGEGAVAIRAAELRDQGLDAKTIAERITVERMQLNQFVTVHSLDALKRSGRVKASSAFLGNLFGVKPIIIADANGYQTPIKKVKGRQASMRECVMLLKEVMTDPKNERVYIAHADCAEEAEELRRIVEQEIGPKEIYVDYIGPIVGSSIGPEAVLVGGFGKEVTFAG